MEKEKIAVQQFDDLSECTEYYYDELGKLKAVENVGHLNKKEVKRVHNFLMSSFFDTMDSLGKKSVVANKMDKVETKESKKEFEQEHKTGVMQAIAAPIKTIGIAIGTSCKAIGKAVKASYGAIGRLITKQPKVDILPSPKQIEGGQTGGQVSSSQFSKGEKDEEDMQDNEKKEGKENPQSEGETD